MGAGLLSAAEAEGRRSVMRDSANSDSGQERGLRCPSCSDIEVVLSLHPFVDVTFANGEMVQLSLDYSPDDSSVFCCRSCGFEWEATREDPFLSASVAWMYRQWTGYTKEGYSSD